MRRLMRKVVVVALVSACATEPPAPPASPEVTLLTPTEHLTRASLALRGVRPSLAELREVTADPTVLGAIVDRYLETPEFGETIRDLHNEVWLLRHQQVGITLPPAGVLAGKTMNEMNGSVFEEALRLIEDVVMTDQPYSTIVTADYTMADPIVATVWGMEHSGNPGWERTHRAEPADRAGILAVPSVFLRYRSAGFNYHRGRANAVSRGLLCHDFLEGHITVDTGVDVSRPDVINNAVVHNPSCAGCHQTLDPLASYFFGYPYGPLPIDAIPSYPVDFYNSDRWSSWFLTTNRPPSYFGRDAVGLEGLGTAIAADPRFARCAAIHFASYLTERDHRDLSPEWIARLQQAFTDDGLNAKHLAKAVVLSDPFRTASSDDPVTAEGVVGYQKVRPAQLRRMLRDLTGFEWSGYATDIVGRRWVAGPMSFLDDDTTGYRVLGGGIDSFFVTSPVHTMNATSSLVVRTAAGKAAAFVVAHDATAPPGERRLFTEATVSTTDEAGVRAELVSLHGRIYGELVAPEDARVSETYALFQGALAASGDPARAWTVTLAGMLSDLRAVYY